MSEEMDDESFDLEKLQQLMELMEKHDLSEINLRKGHEHWRLRRRDHNVVLQAAPAMAPPVYAPPATPVAAPARSADVAPPAAGDPGDLLIKSPAVGTFYVAPTPEDPPFVSIGSRVSPDTIVCTIEAMKVFNPIPSEVAGTITAVLVKNGESVEFGQPLFRVKP